MYMKNHSHHSQTINYDLDERKDETTSKILKKMGELMNLLDKDKGREFDHRKEKIKLISLHTSETDCKPNLGSWRISFENHVPFHIKYS